MLSIYQNKPGEMIRCTIAQATAPDHEKKNVENPKIAITCAVAPLFGATGSFNFFNFLETFLF